MTNRRRGLAGLLAVTAAAAGLAFSAAPAGAADGSNLDPYITLDNLPFDVIDCNVEWAPGALLTFCIEITFDGGQAKFGGVQSEIAGPIKVRQVVSAVLGPGGFEDLEIIIVDEGSEGGGGGLAFPTIDIPGGIVGIPALNDLLKPITGVQAQIQPLGELALNDLNPQVLLDGLFGNEDAAGTLAVAHIPLQVKLVNPLLGETCYIGSAEDPIDLNLPLSLSNPTYWNSSFAPEPQPEEAFLYFVMEADATDAVFDIPEADGCGLLGLGDLLDTVGLNVFDLLVNQVAGLPAPAGTNLLSLQGHLGLTIPGQDGVPG